METIQNIKEELKFFAVTESINWYYDLSQENHRYYSYFVYTSFRTLIFFTYILRPLGLLFCLHIL